MKNLYGNICLSDIPKEFIFVANNGKKYLSIAVNVRKTVGKGGETHYIKVLVPKDQQRTNVVHYIGNLKPSRIQPQQGYYRPQQLQSPQQQGNFETLNAAEDEDLPF